VSYLSNNIQIHRDWETSQWAYIYPALNAQHVGGIIQYSEYYMCVLMNSGAGCQMYISEYSRKEHAVIFETMYMYKLYSFNNNMYKKQTHNIILR
jgi:hypothetical protein